MITGLIFEQEGGDHLILRERRWRWRCGGLAEVG